MSEIRTAKIQTCLKKELFLSLDFRHPTVGQMVFFCACVDVCHKFTLCIWMINNIKTYLYFIVATFINSIFKYNAKAKKNQLISSEMCHLAEFRVPKIRI